MSKELLTIEESRWLKEVIQGQIKRDFSDSAVETEYHRMENAGVDIVIPIYSGIEETERCIRSILEYTSFPFRLLLINDASPEPGMQETLENFAVDSRVQILENEENLGFVKTVNRGFAATEEDVIILNNDTEVCESWLEGLALAAAENPKAATVTPWSSASGIFTLFSEEFVEEKSYHLLAEAVRLVSNGSKIKIPVGHGSCMLIRRSALEKCGYFDAETFGKGYGEETDFCLRCNESGYYHVLTTSVFIRHIGHVSFGPEHEARKQKASIILGKRYPNYPEQLRQLKGNSELNKQKKLLQERTEEFLSHKNTSLAPSKHNLLIAMHRNRGGSFFNRLDLAKGLEQDCNTYLLQGDNKTLTLSILIDGNVIDIKHYRLAYPLGFDTFQREDLRKIYEEIIIRYRIDLGIMSHLLGESFDFVLALKKHGIPSIYCLHDYFMVCPNFSLIDPDGNYCAGKCSAKGRRCLVSQKWIPSEAGPVCEMVPMWRRTVSEYLGLFDFLVAPSNYCARLHARVFPQLEEKIVPVEHGRDFPDDWQYQSSYPKKGENIRLLILGNIGISKGLRSLIALAEADTKHQLEIHILGDVTETNGTDRFVKHGEYQRKDLPELVASIRPHYGFISSIFPETYCHTLTELWKIGLPVIVYEGGVPEERMRDSGGGWIVSPSEPDALIHLLTETISEVEYIEKKKLVNEITFPSVSEMAANYLSLFEKADENPRPQNELERYLFRIEIMNLLRARKNEVAMNLSAISNAEIQRYNEKIRYLQQELNRSRTCTRRRVGDLLAETAMNPITAWKLPVRIIRMLHQDRQKKRGELAEIEKDRKSVTIDAKTTPYLQSIAVLPTLEPSSFAHSKSTRTVRVIVCVHNAPEEAAKCLHSLVCKRTFPYLLTIVDDGSDKETQNILQNYEKLPFVHVIRHETSNGYTVSANEGLKDGEADYYVLLNSDTAVTSNWIEKMLRCFDSDSNYGIISPISNAATWQSWPVKKMEDGWAANPLPSAMNVERINLAVEQVSSGNYIHLECVNGFCLMIRKEVIQQIGYLDELNFPRGYGEEVDYCLRAEAAGFSCRILTDTYIHHQKTASFSTEEKKKLNALSKDVLQEKHGGRYRTLSARLAMTYEGEIKPYLKKIEQQVISMEEKYCRLQGKKIAFLLHAGNAAGGNTSVIQEAEGMRTLGLDVSIINHKKFRQSFPTYYPEAVPYTCWYEKTPASLAKDFDLVICTIFHSVEKGVEMQQINPDLRLAYYVQDYEPWFFPEEDANYLKARDSYTLVPDALLFAKTDWICEKVEKEHPGVKVKRVRASINRAMYNPYLIDTIEEAQKITVSAMVRTSTERRRPFQTLEFLRNLKETFGNEIDLVCFGSKDEEIRNLVGEVPEGIRNLGRLRPDQVAEVIAGSHVFLDLSSYQAFGRTGIEAMALGCVPILPDACGTAEYGEDRVNAVLVNTLSPEALQRTVALIRDPAKLKEMAVSGIETAKTYNVITAAWSEIERLAEWI